MLSKIPSSFPSGSGVLSLSSHMKLSVHTYLTPGYSKRPYFFLHAVSIPPNSSQLDLVCGDQDRNRKGDCGLGRILGYTGEVEEEDVTEHNWRRSPAIGLGYTTI
jgi:hypothetical protein